MNEIIVDVSFEQTRVALLENEELNEVYIERYGSKRNVGSIYKGRVENVLPGMQAAFVNIGLEKNAFLYVKDAFVGYENVYPAAGSGENVSIKDLLKKGQEVMVQVVKEPLDGKGARVTTNITLPSRFMVLLPNADYVGISRRIESEEERSRLKEIALAIKPDNMGLIIRTASEGKDPQDFKQDLKVTMPRALNSRHNTASMILTTGPASAISDSLTGSSPDMPAILTLPPRGNRRISSSRYPKKAAVTQWAAS
jgi:ribonuclease G